VGTITCAVDGVVLRVSDRLKKRNCLGLAASRCGMYGVPVRLTTSELWSDCGLSIGVPVKER